MHQQRRQLSATVLLRVEVDQLVLGTVLWTVHMERVGKKVDESAEKERAIRGKREKEINR